MLADTTQMGEMGETTLIPGIKFSPLISIHIFQTVPQTQYNTFRLTLATQYIVMLKTSMIWLNMQFTHADVLN